MNFYITENMITDLYGLCQDSKLEQCGVMNFKKEYNEFYLQDYSLCEETEIETSDEKCIYVSDEYKKRIILEMHFLNEFEGVIVRFHTHPKKHDLAYPSPQDKEFMRNMQRVVDVANKGLQKDFIYVEGIITNQEIGFYCLNKMNNKIERIRVFTQSREIVPKKMVIIKDIPQIFSEGLKKSLKKFVKNK